MLLVGATSLAASQPHVSCSHVTTNNFCTGVTWNASLPLSPSSLDTAAKADFEQALDRLHRLGSTHSLPMCLESWKALQCASKFQKCSSELPAQKVSAHRKMIDRKGRFTFPTHRYHPPANFSERPFATAHGPHFVFDRCVVRSAGNSPLRATVPTLCSPAATMSCSMTIRHAPTTRSCHLCAEARRVGWPRAMRRNRCGSPFPASRPCHRCHSHPHLSNSSRPRQGCRCCLRWACYCCIAFAACCSFHAARHTRTMRAAMIDERVSVPCMSR